MYPDDWRIRLTPGMAVAACIQGLNQKLEEKLKQKQTEITELKQTVGELKQLVSRLVVQQKINQR